ncbi:hypothetical protein [Oceanibaculum nanhaiense]|uniref:hypothetical protein n=1 Tax=Oceanibaculum nanhaiense TaxID=1909734 RepID=UPI00396EDB82
MKMDYIPKIGGRAVSDFPLQFKNSNISSISISCSPILQLSNDGLDSVVSHASGFFWRKGKRCYFVTARHVLTGKEPFEDKIMSKSGYIPRSFMVYPSILKKITHGRN